MRTKLDEIAEEAFAAWYGHGGVLQGARFTADVVKKVSKDAAERAFRHGVEQARRPKDGNQQLNYSWKYMGGPLVTNDRRREAERRVPGRCRVGFSDNSFDGDTGTHGHHMYSVDGHYWRPDRRSG